MSGIEKIAAERQRQIEAEGWSKDHDSQYTDGQLWQAAICYARDFGCAYLSHPPRNWPWSKGWWKPKSRIENLVRAGALIAAEIDRLESTQE